MSAKETPAYRVSIKIGRDLWSAPLLARYVGARDTFKIISRSPIWHGAEIRKSDIHLIRTRLGLNK
jgi:hypothetical protein